MRMRVCCKRGVTVDEVYGTLVDKVTVDLIIVYEFTVDEVDCSKLRLMYVECTVYC